MNRRAYGLFCLIAITLITFSGPSKAEGLLDRLNVKQLTKEWKKLERDFHTFKSAAYYTGVVAAREAKTKLRIMIDPDSEIPSDPPAVIPYAPQAAQPQAEIAPSCALEDWQLAFNPFVLTLNEAEQAKVNSYVVAAHQAACITHNRQQLAENLDWINVIAFDRLGKSEEAQDAADTVAGLRSAFKVAAN